MRELGNCEVTLVSGSNGLTEFATEVYDSINTLSFSEKAIAVSIGVAACFSPWGWAGPLAVKMPLSIASTLVLAPIAKAVLRGK